MPLPPSTNARRNLRVSCAGYATCIGSSLMRSRCRTTNFQLGKRLSQTTRYCCARNSKEQIGKTSCGHAYFRMRNIQDPPGPERSLPRSRTRDHTSDTEAQIWARPNSLLSLERCYDKEKQWPESNHSKQRYDHDTEISRFCWRFFTLCPCVFIAPAGRSQVFP